MWNRAILEICTTFRTNMLPLSSGSSKPLVSVYRTIRRHNWITHSRQKLYRKSRACILCFESGNTVTYTKENEQHFMACVVTFTSVMWVREDKNTKIQVAVNCVKTCVSCVYFTPNFLPNIFMYAIVILDYYKNIWRFWQYATRNKTQT